jgi:putative oxidoreductase
MMKWIFRVLQGLLILIFLMSGMMKVFSSSQEIATLYTDTLGYSVIFMRMVGIAETIAALGLIVCYRWPRLTLAFTGVLVLIMSGATISILTTGQGVLEAVLPFVLLVIALAVFFLGLTKKL